MQLFVNDLTVMDFSYLCPRRGMVGESWIVDVILDGNLNDESMIQDFGKVKKNLKKLIDEYVDHKLLVPLDYTGSTVTHRSQDEQVEVRFESDDNKIIQLFCPAEAYAFVYAAEVTMASVGNYLREVIATHLPDNVANIDLKLRPEQILTPFYHYTHGLKKHDGNCQRIAHGHRSKIGIIIDGQDCLESQQYWAQRWQDIYIISTEDLIEYSQLQASGTVENPDEYYCCAYESSQGYFELVIPRSACEVIETDSTVECLAQYVYNEQKKRSGNSSLQVMAYEGVGKGAIVGD
ncbi:6-carboxytetrahydropterin synthase [Salinimonas marina]|uniref:6-carboxy-5,6,7,8-tetrahydropterin synthase n=1 Tax=Salinimonas marina TaxID=2785918 RepID=A0A7S9DUW1_9ALTE|nr:6-carboxytetrahydropterin synthase [Salinimonas marina]QPG04313.1 6-carboxytetrahydropterin synthase [Salinimonas marina]